MKYYTLAGGALAVPAIILGTADFGAAVPQPEAFALLDHYAASGGTMLDTAHVYGQWAPGGHSLSEELIGRWLKERSYPGAMQIATKGAHPLLDNGHGKMGPPRLAPGQIAQDLDESLRHLGVERVDLYYLHRDDPSRPVEEIMDTLQALRLQGKLRFLGASNWRSDRIKAANEYAAACGFEGFVVYENQYSAAKLNPDAGGDPTIVTVSEEDLPDYARLQVLLAAFTSQARGYFTKLHAMGPSGLSQLARIMYDSPVNRARLAAMETIADETGYSITQITLGYLFGHGAAAIIGPQRMEQLSDSLTAQDVALSPEQVRLIDQAGR